MPSMANTLNGNGVSLQVPAGNNLNDAKHPARPKEKLTRTLSASTLRDRLSKLAATPLNVPNPVATLHANVKYVHLSLFWQKWGVGDPLTYFRSVSYRLRFRGSGGCRCWLLRFGRCRLLSLPLRFCTFGMFHLFALLRWFWVIDLGTCSSIPPLWPLLAVYLFWVRCIDKSPENGGRTSQWFRSLSFWKYFADYYPASYAFLCFRFVMVVLWTLMF